jgi:hypothetical protein
MRVLIACEFSGIVRDAFAGRGHDAWSCDLLPAERAGNHHVGDVLDYIRCWPYLFDPLMPWDLMIAFPPCTHLAVSGARWFAGKQREQAEAIRFVETLWTAAIPRIAIENPVGILSTRSILGKPAQIIQPWQFGHGEVKSTCLWLKNLPPLKPTNIVGGRIARVHREPPGPERWKNRSRTYQGIANVMAEQWSEHAKS